MDVRQLRYFIAAARHASFNKAAEELHISQSALGSQIRNLEQELGAELFDRHSQGAVITPRGKVLLDYAEDITEKIQQAKAAVAQSQRQFDADVVLGLTPTSSRLLGARILYKVGEKYPNLQLRLMEENSSTLVQRVLSQEASLALAFSYSATPIPGLRWEPALEEHLYFAESASPGKSSQGTLTLADALAHPLVLPSLPASVRSAIEHAAASVGLTLNVVYNADSDHTIRTVISQKGVASIMPFASIKEFVESGDLVARRVVSPSVYRDLYFVAAEQSSLGRGAYLVKRELQLLMREEVRSGGSGWYPLRDRTAAVDRAYLSQR